MLYRIDLGQAAQRRLLVALEAEIGELPPVPEARPDERVFFLPIWTPGSYLVREYARNVSRVRAVDHRGDPLPVRKVAKNRWAVRVGEVDRVRVEWTVYAHDLSVRTAFASAEWAFWNGASTLLWPVGAEDSGADVEVRLPAGWILFAGSEAVDEGGGTARYRCRDLDQALDTPCLAGPLRALSFDVLGVEHRFVAAGLAGVELPDTLLADLREVVAATAGVFGGEPPFARYTFLALFGSNGRGGLEHADSSALLAPRTSFHPRSSYEDFLALVAHEYLHVWNVKRMRPTGLWQVDYERENHTRLLWVAEGFTAYYDDLLVRRAEACTPSAYLERLASHVRAMRANPGRGVQSLGDASYDAWILLYRPDENTRNATQSYYTNGALAALVVDAEIRRRTGGARSLDDAMRSLWRRTFERARGYDVEDVIGAIDEAAGCSLGRLVTELTEAPFEPDLDTSLDLFGLRLVAEKSGTPRLGVRFRAGGTVLMSVEDDGPAWIAGLCPGDEVVGVGGLRVQGSTWQAVWDHVAAADREVRFLVAREGVLREFEVVPRPSDMGRLRIVPVDQPSEPQLAHREAWLGAREV